MYRSGIILPKLWALSFQFSRTLDISIDTIHQILDMLAAHRTAVPWLLAYEDPVGRRPYTRKYTQHTHLLVPYEPRFTGLLRTDVLLLYFAHMYARSVNHRCIIWQPALLRMWARLQQVSQTCPTAAGRV